MPRKHIYSKIVNRDPTWTAFKKGRNEHNLVFRRQKPAFISFARRKGVWLEMGDNMGHFMDVKLLSFKFSHHPKSILTLYPPNLKSSLVFRRQQLAFTPFATAKGVWLEMGDNMGHFMDVTLLSFKFFTPSQVNSNPLPPSPGPPLTEISRLNLIILII